jgi:hypothetical protein
MRTALSYLYDAAVMALEAAVLTAFLATLFVWLV